MSGKRNVGKTLTILIMFLITVTAILVIFSYFTGLISFSGQQSHDVSISGVFALDPDNASEGTLAFSITNLSSASITQITVVCPSSQFASISCNGLTFADNSGPISSSNSVKTNGAAGGSTLVTLAPGVSLSAGSSSVSTTVVATFSDGTVHAYPVSLPTQE